MAQTRTLIGDPQGSGAQWDTGEVAPGAWLRLAAMGAAVATALVVASGALTLGLPHTVLAIVGVPLLAAVVVVAAIAHPRMLVVSIAALALFVVESAFGGVIALAGRPEWAVVLHVAFAGLALAVALLNAAESFRGERVPAGAWRDYVALTKPRIMLLLLITAAAGMFVGAGGLPNLPQLAVVLAGGALACAGASALNHYLDRDIDALMGDRTSDRPIVAGRLIPPRAVEFGLVLSAFSFVLLASLVNVLTATLALVGGLFYVLVYTQWLKRWTVQNIVIGGAAGAVPPLVGWAAATGNLTLPAIFLFLIIFFWTPPHFWSLALLIKREYAAARIPMMPVVRGDRETSRQIVAYSLILAATTLLPFLWHSVGGLYLGVALALDAVFIGLALSLARGTNPARAGRLFHFSLLYLAILFSAMAVDTVVVV
ncbi:MAG: heme o synthase [Solirubrobacterales bacterium]